MKTGWRSQWVLVLLGMSLAACGEAPTPNAPFEPASTAQAAGAIGKALIFLTVF